MSLELFLISETASLRDALTQLDANHHGIILTTNSSGVTVGLATDGDVRRKLLEGASLDDAVASCANPNFVWADSATSRELLLKQLDHRIQVIPLLDAHRRLTGIVSRDYLPVQIEEPVYARARAPVRISFGGGGSDLTHFFAGEGGAVINTTISLYSHATLRKRDDLQVFVHSRDLGASLVAPDLQHVLYEVGPFGLIQALLKTVHPEFGFELYLHSDFPMNSGLGGSAVVSAVVLGCFNQFRQDRWDLHELAELAFQAERLYLGVAGGWQDQYATVFGGFNFMEFRMDQNIVHPLRIPTDVQLELEESLVLCDTGTPHDSGDIHEDQRNQMQQEGIRQKVQSNVELTYRMRNHLLRGRLLQFGQSLHEAWQFKRQFSSKISSRRLDQIYDDACANGAVGGKLLGAGGGGFFLFYVTPFRKHQLIAKLESLGLNVRPFRFEQEGLRAWSAREGKNQPQPEHT
ncbi:CBS domain-containing protein [Polaromonas sp.]|uniref:GHMP family kinase ATP-binding protein n=1 Tax=Polaromonas sp. TaxID=1869339 RepID=UPI0037C7D79C